MTYFIFISLGLINLVTLFVFGSDKLFARAGSSRVRERTLLALALLGGSPGALVAMKLFHHKTRKSSFQIIFAVILLAQLAAGLWLAARFNFFGALPNGLPNF